MASKKDKLSLAGSSALNKFFSAADAQNVPQSKDPAPEITDQAEEKKAPEKALKASGKKVFSFRGDPSAVTSWRLFADAAGMKVDDLGSAALEEYIKNHPLTADQQKIYNIKLKQKNR